MGRSCWRARRDVVESFPLFSAACLLGLASVTQAARADQRIYREAEPLQIAEWTRVLQGGFGDPALHLFGQLAEFQGFLYLAADHKAAGCQIWRSPDGSMWESVVAPGAVIPDGFGNRENHSINE